MISFMLMVNDVKRQTTALTNTHVHADTVSIQCTHVRPRANLPSNALRWIQQAELGRDLPTPINWQELDRLLDGYPVEKRSYVIQCLRFGFKLGYNGHTCVYQTKNAATVRHDEGATLTLIDKELEAGRFMGPFDDIPFDHLHLSPHIDQTKIETWRISNGNGSICPLHL